MTCAGHLLTVQHLVLGDIFFQWHCLNSFACWPADSSLCRRTCLLKLYLLTTTPQCSHVTLLSCKKDIVKLDQLCSLWIFLGKSVQGYSKVELMLILARWFFFSRTVNGIFSCNERLSFPLSCLHIWIKYHQTNINFSALCLAGLMNVTLSPQQIFPTPAHANTNIS